MVQANPGTEKVALWRDERFWKIIFQIVVVGILLTIVAIAINNMNVNLARQGRQFEFKFLIDRAGFNIGETVLPYKVDDPYYWGLIVGLANTLRLCLVSVVLATIFGVVAGIASFSSNWLLRKLSLVYVEVLRNTPPLLQFFFWYVVVFFGLSSKGQVTRLTDFLLISKKGIWIPWPAGNIITALSLGLLLAGAIAAIVLWRSRLKRMEEEGASGRPQRNALVVIGVICLGLFVFGLQWVFPKPVGGGNDVVGGLRMSLEYGAMMMGLSAYIGAFIAEIVRAGIQATPTGQWEAGRALGLPDGHLMRLVVLPQALRIIIPSLNSQYATLIKNSSLSLAIGYPDIFSTAQTTLNQTGRAVEVVLLMILTYLTLNVIVSFFMNVLNQAVQFQER